MTATHIATGTLGERMAVAHLRRDGMRILDRNWACRIGELDIVAQDGATVVFCEVKTRRSLRFGTPFSAIDATKAARIDRLAHAWRRETRRWSFPRRFDAVCIVIRPNHTAHIDHRRGVF